VDQLPHFKKPARAGAVQQNGSIDATREKVTGRIPAQT
jgi:hypothetical protein